MLHPVAALSTYAYVDERYVRGFYLTSGVYTLRQGFLPYVRRLYLTSGVSTLRQASLAVIRFTTAASRLY